MTVLYILSAAIFVVFCVIALRLGRILGKMAESSEEPLTYSELLGLKSLAISVEDIHTWTMLDALATWTAFAHERLEAVRLALWQANPSLDYRTEVIENDETLVFYPQGEHGEDKFLVSIFVDTGGEGDDMSEIPVFSILYNGELSDLGLPKCVFVYDIAALDPVREALRNIPPSPEQMVGG